MPGNADSTVGTIEKERRLFADLHRLGATIL
jgi:hypothetical protein